MTRIAIASHPAGHAPPPSAAPRDRWVVWPAVAAIVTVSALTFLCGLPGLISFCLIPISVLLYLVAALTIFVSAEVCFFRGEWRRSISTILVLIMPILLWTPIVWATDCVHLRLTVSFGIGALGGVPAAGGPFTVYDWSTGLAGGPATFLLHDTTDGIAVPLARQKHTAAYENGFGQVCAGRSTHLVVHYYVCTFN